MARITKPFAAIAMCLLMGCTASPKDSVDGDHEISKGFEACINQSGGITSSMNRCYSNEQSRLDYKLSRLLRSAKAKRSPTGITRLDEEQETWERGLSRYCEQVVIRSNKEALPSDEVADANQFGTLDDLMLRSCILDQTSDRVDRLRHELGVTI